MLKCSLDQEWTFGRKPLTVPAGHTLDTKWPWSIYTGFLSENVKPECSSGTCSASAVEGHTALEFSSSELGPSRQ